MLERLDEARIVAEAVCPGHDWNEKLITYRARVCANHEEMATHWII
ncbi:hypothetical protein G5B41_05720 [bacterium SGD-2]|jgi:hypothetical protein|nr:hypothetical protein [bacterium SGD-2]